MSPDVKELGREKLAGGKFPADSRADFRLYIAPEVRRGIIGHAKADVTIEICGVLVGGWETDDDGPYARVTDFIRCENASSKFAEVTFTHESWAQINKEMDSRFADARIVGWYHSHPDFGIFLSDRDCFIQQHFFSGPGQVAYVIDPVRDLEGVFAWRDGKPALLPHFWIGNRIITAEASERPADAHAGKSLTATSNSPSQADGSPSGLGFLGWATAALALLAAFWLGHIYGGWRSQWEQRMIVEGVVSHLGDAVLVPEGLDSKLAGIQARLQMVSNEMSKLPDPTAQLSKEQAEEASQRRTQIRDTLALCEVAIAWIQQHYSLNDAERAAFADIGAQRLAAMQKMIDRETEKAKAAQQPAPATPSNATDAETKNTAKATDLPSDSKNAPPTTSAAPPAK